MNVRRCLHCGTLTYPAHYLCHRCRHSDFENVELGDGTLLTFTVIHVPPPGVPSPLAIGIVEFEGGVRALGQLSEPMEVGSKVTAEWGVLRRVAGKEYEGFRFHLALTEGPP